MSIRAITASTALLALLVSSSPAWAQQHIADPAAMQQAITQQQATETANREIVAKVLGRPDVQIMAARMGMSVQTARTAAAQLSGQDLAQAATAARAIDDPAGGADTIVISTTTLLLIIILVLLIAR
jgi:hypothetical protein